MILQFVIFRSRADELMHVHHELVRVFPATFHFISDNVRYFQDVFTFTEYFFFSAVLLGPVSLYRAGRQRADLSGSIRHLESGNRRRDSWTFENFRFCQNL